MNAQSSQHPRRNANNVNISVIGDSAVGKTTYINRLCTGSFTKRHTPTKGAYSKGITVSTNKGSFRINFIENASEVADGYILMFDVTNKKSYENLPLFYREISIKCAFGEYNQKLPYFLEFAKKVCTKDIGSYFLQVVSILIYESRKQRPIVLCGNKYDRAFKVKQKNIIFHKTCDVKYFNISAKSNYNFEKPFLEILKRMHGDDLVFICGQPTDIPTVNI